MRFLLVLWLGNREIKMSGNPTERTKNESVRFALAMGKRPHFAQGGVVGPLFSNEGGRTDTLPISVPSGAYVIPADVVSGLPGAEGSSLAGHNLLGKLFSMQPFSADAAPYGASSVPLKHKRGLARAKGGKADDETGHPVQIMAAGGEHVVDPETVKRLGNGDLTAGHKVLDAFVKHVRAENIKSLKKLPGPAKR